MTTLCQSQTQLFVFSPSQGNYFAAGGAIRGNQIHGRYPDGLTDEDPLILNRGRVIPTTGFDSVFNAFAEWFGVEKEQDLNAVLPDRGRMSQLLGKDHVFMDDMPTLNPTASPTQSLNPTANPTRTPTRTPTNRPSRKKRGKKRGKTRRKKPVKNILDEEANNVDADAQNPSPLDVKRHRPHKLHQLHNNILT